MVHFQTDGERILMADAQTGEPLGGFRALLMRPGNDNYWNPFHMIPASVKEGELVFQTRSGSVTLTLRYEEAPDGLAATLAAAGEGKGVVRLLWDLPEDDYFPFVPAFMYGINRGGASKWATYPQLEEGDNGGFHRPWVRAEWAGAHRPLQPWLYLHVGQKTLLRPRREGRLAAGRTAR